MLDNMKLCWYYYLCKLFFIISNYYPVIIISLAIDVPKKKQHKKTCVYKFSEFKAFQSWVSFWPELPSIMFNVWKEYQGII